MSDFQDYVTGLQMLGGVLALPRSAQYAQESALAHRRMLEDTGIDPADIQAMYPDAPLGFLRAGGPGIGRKILGGVGDVGALLSTIAGKPVGPPRLNISDIAESSKLRKSFKEQQLTNQLAAKETDPTAKILLETGNLETFGRYKAAQARGGVGGSYLAMRERLNRMAPDDPDRPALEKALRDYDVLHPGPQPPKTPAEIATEETERQRARDKVEAERRENVIRQNPQWTDDQKSYYRANGSLLAPERPEREKPIDFVRDIYNEVLKEHQAAANQIRHDEGPDAPGATVDPEAVKRDAMERARSFTAGGWKINNMPPEGPPTAPRETGIGMSTGETEPPVVPARPPTETPTPPAAPKKSPLGDIQLIPEAQRTPEQRAAIAAVKADADAAQKAGKPLAPDIIRQRIKAIPGLVAK